MTTTPTPPKPCLIMQDAALTTEEHRDAAAWGRHSFQAVNAAPMHYWVLHTYASVVDNFRGVLHPVITTWASHVWLEPVPSADAAVLALNGLQGALRAIPLAKDCTLTYEVGDHHEVQRTVAVPTPASPNPYLVTIHATTAKAWPTPQPAHVVQMGAMCDCKHNGIRALCTHPLNEIAQSPTDPTPPLSFVHAHLQSLLVGAA